MTPSMMTLKSTGFKSFAEMIRGSYVFFCSNCISFNPTSHLKTVFGDGVTVKFWAGKCHVLAMKKLSIPRTELLLCLFLANLMVPVVKAVKSEARVEDIFC